MQGKHGGSKARKESDTEELNEQSVFSKQSEPSDGIV